MKTGRGHFAENRYFGLLFVILLGVFVFVTFLDSSKGGERYLLKGGAPIVVSLDHGSMEQEWTPVRMDIQGLVFTFWMDAAGRVFGERNGSSLLFRMDKTRGRLRNAGWEQTGTLIEPEAAGPRYRFDEMSAALVLDIPEGKAALDLKGLLVPVSVLFGPEADGVRELRIGDRNGEDSARLCLDTRKKQLFWAPRYYAGRKDGSSRVVWAVN